MLPLEDLRTTLELLPTLGESLVFFSLLCAGGLLLLNRLYGGRTRPPADAPAPAPSPPRILIIDDDDLYANSMGQLLARKGFLVNYAYTLRDAKFLIRAMRYDCIFCDFHLNGAKGTEILDRHLDDARKRRCVIISGSGREEVMATTPSPYSFLKKPFSPDELVTLASRFSGPAPEAG